MRLTEAEFNDLVSRRTKAGLAKSPKSMGAKKAIRQSRRGPNKTEWRFEMEYLKPMLAMGEITKYQFEAVKLRIGNGVTFCPDFWSVTPSGLTKFWEVKGAFIYDDAVVKIKTAASIYPYEFYLAQYVKGEWMINRVLP